MSVMKTLVIHPTDASTDFLKPIYEGRGWTVMNKIVSNSELVKAFKSHDRIVMMGHGYEQGLFEPKRGVIISSKHVYLLRQKECVGIWCNADVFFRKYELKGFYTGMIISEMDEAYVYGVQYNSGEIEQSNTLFAQTIAKYIDDTNIVERAYDEYASDTNNIIKFNRENLYKRS
jgi:hypothetical protein